MDNSGNAPIKVTAAIFGSGTFQSLFGMLTARAIDMPSRPPLEAHRHPSDWQTSNRSDNGHYVFTQDLWAGLCRVCGRADPESSAALGLADELLVVVGKRASRRSLIHGSAAQASSRIRLVPPV